MPKTKKKKCLSCKQFKKRIGLQPIQKTGVTAFCLDCGNVQEVKPKKKKWYKITLYTTDPMAIGDAIFKYKGDAAFVDEYLVQLCVGKNKFKDIGRWFFSGYEEKIKKLVKIKLK